MSIETIFILLLIAAAAALWAQQSKISVKASAAAKNYVESQNLQFLDQSVVLMRFRVAWNASSGPCLRRTYEFEFTQHGQYRYTGSLIMIGRKVLTVSLPPIVETPSH